MTGAPAADAARGRVAVARLATLLVLVLVAFWPDVGAIFRVALRNPDACHLLAAMPFIVIMTAFRRERLRARLTSGSAWGVVVVGAALALYVGSSWPFNFGYPRFVAIVVALGGAILTVAGWGVLRTCLPMLFILLIALPIGQRQYATLILLPERYTIEAVQATLNVLPGVTVELIMPDLRFTRQGAEGVIALGETQRGATLLLSTMLLGAFLTLIRPRPWWQIAVMVLLTGPVVLLVNFLRLLVWGLIAVYAQPAATSATPRVVSIVVSLLAAWGLYAAALVTLRQMLVEEPAPAAEGAAGGST